MMIIGISGCTALLLTGFGINDSISGFADNQYGKIQVGDGVITLNTSIAGDREDERFSSLKDRLEEDTSCYDLVSESTWDLVHDGGVKSVNMVIMEEPEHVDRYMKFADKDGAEIEYPGKGEAVINTALAEQYDLKTGDVITVRDSEMKEIRVSQGSCFSIRMP